MANREFARCTAGSIAIEMALTIPIIVLILYSAVDLSRLYHLNSKAGQASKLIADYFSQADTLSESVLSEALGASKVIMGEYLLSAQVSLVVTAIRVHGDLGQKVLWRRQQLDGTGSCASTPFQPVVPKPDIVKPAAIQVFYQIDLCIEADPLLFSSVLSMADIHLLRTAISLAHTPAIRQFE